MKINKSHINIIITLIFIVAFGLLAFKFGLFNKFDRIQNKAQEISQFCRKNQLSFGNKETCYSKEFNTLAEKVGIEESFKVLSSLQIIDEDTKGCHLIAHGIGAGSFKKEPNNWRMLVQNMNTSCNYGGIHGVIESYLGTVPSKSLSKEVIPTICGENPRADCNHIVGHILLVVTDADVDKALDLCEVFSPGIQRDFCFNGVFMEYQTAINLIAHDLVPETWLNWPSRLNSIEKLCRSYNTLRAEACWEEIVHVAAVTFKNDPKKVFDLCDSAQVPNGAKKCKRHSIGVIGASKRFDLMQLKSMCSIYQKNDPNFEAECYPALVSSSLSTVPSAVPEAVNFCKSLEEKFKSQCFNMIGLMLVSGQVKKEQLSSACKNLEENYKTLCLGNSYANKTPYVIRTND